MDKNKLILLVDDLPENLKLLGDLLEREGYEVRGAIDGPSALEIARIITPDLIILDILMPGMDGFEVCRRLKKDDLLKVIPVIFISAIDDTAKKVGAFTAGGVDYITKPFQVEEVAARVRTHLALSQLEALKAEVQERRLAEARLKRSLEEREVLIREVHHRVKNNLNVICSLLRLQASSLVRPEQAIEAFDTCLDRILSIAMVHESVYQCSDSAHIDLNLYMKNLVSKIASDHVLASAIELEVICEGIVMDINSAVPFGIVLNELVTNAYLHAFSQRSRGRLKISLSALSKESLELCVEDDGCGGASPPQLASGGLGLVLAQLMVEQLGGTMSLLPGAGTCWRIVFPRQQSQNMLHVLGSVAMSL